MGLSAPAIQQELERLYGKRHINTIRNQVRRLHRDASEPWHSADESFSPGAARAVLDELRAVDRASEGRVLSFTKREAWWIARLRMIWGLELGADGSAYVWARDYVRAEQEGADSVAALDFRLQYHTGAALPVGQAQRRGGSPVLSEPQKGGRR